MASLFKITFRWILAVMFCCLSEAKKPNFLILYADDLGIGDVGCFGNDTIRTPNIDSLCRDGAKLSHHLAAASVCTPSRAAFLTGRYPIRSGMSSNIDIPIFVNMMSYSGLPANETTFPKKMQEGGYATGMIGKWHLGIHSDKRGDFGHFPTNHGFDHFFGSPMTNHRGLNPLASAGDVVWHRFPRLKSVFFTSIAASLLSAMFLWKRRFRFSAIIFIMVFGALPLFILFLLENGHRYNSGLWRNNVLVEQPIVFTRMTQRLVNEGVNFLQQRSEDGKPFLLMMSWFQVHTFLHSEQPFKGNSKHGRYGDEVEELDWSVGEMLGALRRFGFEDDTVVYFSADNGGHIEEVGLDGRREGGHNGIHRGSKFQGGQEGGYREPAAIRFPGRIKPGIQISEPTSQMDIFPTFLKLADLEIPTDRIIDGEDMMPALTGKQTVSPHRFIFHHCCKQIHSMRYRPYVDTGKHVYKLHLFWPNWDEGTMGCFGRFSCGCYSDHRELKTPKLYNIAEDPGEIYELDVTDRKYADIMDIMLKGMREHQDSVDEVPNQFHLRYSMYRPWLHFCCNFPFCQCTDPRNALTLDL